MTATVLLSGIISFAYVWFALRMYSLWKRIPTLLLHHEVWPFISVIICMRNESRNISRVLEALVLQDYPEGTFEIIVADDSSEDDSVLIVEKFAMKHPERNIKILKAASMQKPGKKFALASAAKDAKGEVVAMTDADCTMNNTWLKTMVSHHITSGAELTAGPVRLTGSSFFQHLQQIEFMSLAGTTGSFIQMRKPLMVNAANLMFNKQSFIDSGRLNPQESMASGDDTFFMLKLAEKNPDAISFCKQEAAIVETPALPSWHEFIQQRIRWASKTKHYPAFYIRLTGISLFAFHVIIILFVTLAVVNPAFVVPASVLLFSKWMADAILLALYNRFFKIRTGLLAWIITFLLHPLYLTLIPLLTLKRNYRWKGRTGKT